MLGNRRNKTAIFILPSGVEMSVRAMKAEDQAFLQEGVQGIGKFVAACTESIGSFVMPYIGMDDVKLKKKAFNKRIAKVDSLLHADFKFALLNIRILATQHRENSNFPFTLDWSAFEKQWDNEGKSYALKTEDIYQLDLKEIITAPYPWVETDDEGLYVKQYDDYDQMLKEHSKFNFEFKDAYGDLNKMRGFLPTVAKEKEIAESSIKHPALLAIKMFTVQVENIITGNNGQESVNDWVDVPLDQLEPEEPAQIIDLITPFSAKVNTSVEAEHPESGDKQVIDIVMTTDFFMLGQVN